MAKGKCPETRAPLLGARPRLRRAAKRRPSEGETKPPPAVQLSPSGVGTAPGPAGGCAARLPLRRSAHPRAQRLNADSPEGAPSGLHPRPPATRGQGSSSQGLGGALHVRSETRGCSGRSHLHPLPIRPARPGHCCPPACRGLTFWVRLCRGRWKPLQGPWGKAGCRARLTPGAGQCCPCELAWSRRTQGGEVV